VIFTAGADVISAPFSVKPAAGTTGDNSGSAKSGLANTGADNIAGLAVAGMVLLVAGAGIVLARRRQSADQG